MGKKAQKKSNPKKSKQHKKQSRLSQPNPLFSSSPASGPNEKPSEETVSNIPNFPLIYFEHDDDSLAALPPEISEALEEGNLERLTPERFREIVGYPYRGELWEGGNLVYSLRHENVPAVILFQEEGNVGLGLKRRESGTQWATIPVLGVVKRRSDFTDVEKRYEWASVVNEDEGIVSSDTRALNDFPNCAFPNAFAMPLMMNTEIVTLNENIQSAYSQSMIVLYVAPTEISSKETIEKEIYWDYGFQKFKLQPGFKLLNVEAMREFFKVNNFVDDNSPIFHAIKKHDEKIHSRNVGFNNNEKKKGLIYSRCEYLFTTPVALLDILVQGILSMQQVSQLSQLLYQGQPPEEYSLNVFEVERLHQLELFLKSDQGGDLRDIINGWIECGHIDKCLLLLGQSWLVTGARSGDVYDQEGSNFYNQVQRCISDSPIGMLTAARMINESYAGVTEEQNATRGLEGSSLLFPPVQAQEQDEAKGFFINELT